MALRKNKKRISAALSGLGNDPGKKLARAVLLALLVLMGFAHLKSAFLAQLAMNSGPQMAHFSSSLTHPDALALLAGKEHLANGNLARAQRLYQRGLAHFVLHVPSWLGMVDLFNDLDRKNRAVAALRFVDGFAANTEDVAWTKALLAHELDREDILAENLLWLARHHPGRMAEIFSLAELRWPDPAVILHRFGPGLSTDLLLYYIRINAPDNAETVWREIDRARMISPDTALAYVNFLLRQEKIEQAGQVWNSCCRRDDSLLFNPGLREPFVNSGFAWRITRVPGVSWEPASGDGGLRIQFDGTENVPFQLQQIVPLSPGPYVFRGYMATSDLTTDQLPSWSISGYQCRAPTITGAMPPATAERHEFFLPFDVPEECRAIQVTLRRKASYFFDNKISGTIAVDGLAIEPLPSAADSAGLMPATPRAPEVKSPGRTGININRLTVQ